MKEIKLIGVGMGLDTVTNDGIVAIRDAEVLIGAQRMLSLFSNTGKSEVCAYLPDDVLSAVEESEYERFAVLLSGDTGFFSAADGLVQTLSKYDIKLIPGISSMSYLFARLKRPWQEAAFISCHGREENLVDTVRRNRLTFVLTGENVPELGVQLCDAGFGKLCVTVGENLGTPNERIRNYSITELSSAGIGALSVLLIENPDYDARVRCGIKDDEFVRGNVPMTKAEVRAATLSKLSLFPDAVCCDIGCGTGSVTVEMALAAYRGHVYALDKNPEAILLTTQNSKRFHVGNIIPLLGSAPETLDSVPALDAAFIGGSVGRMDEIFAAILGKNPRARIVVNAITLESLHSAQAAFAAHDIQPEIVQLCVNRIKPAAGLHMIAAQNPVFILSGGGYE